MSEENDIQQKLNHVSSMQDYIKDKEAEIERLRTRLEDKEERYKRVSEAWLKVLAENAALRTKLDKVSQVIIDVWGKKELDKILNE